MSFITYAGAKRLFHELKRIWLLCFLRCKASDCSFHRILLLNFVNRSHFFLFLTRFWLWFLLLNWFILLWLLLLLWLLFRYLLLILIIQLILLLYLCHLCGLLLLFLCLSESLLFKQSCNINFPYFLQQSSVSHSRSSSSFPHRSEQPI